MPHHPQLAARKLKLKTSFLRNQLHCRLEIWSEDRSFCRYEHRCDFTFGMHAGAFTHQ